MKTTEAITFHQDLLPPSLLVKEDGLKRDAELSCMELFALLHRKVAQANAREKILALRALKISVHWIRQRWGNACTSRISPPSVH